MKIEIGESLIRTWMRHCMGSQLAELNWKPSRLWDESAPITPELEQLYYDGKAQFSEDVFKKTSNLKQFLGQAEIDVLGLCVTRGKIDKIIAADVAFHIRGLQYGSKDETTARITKKMFRTALTIERYFSGIPAEILFLSPKVAPAKEPKALNVAKMMHSFFTNRSDKFQFRTIINTEFKKDVLDEIAKIQNYVDDTSELFLRSAQLIALFDNVSPASSRTINTPKMSTSILPTQILPIQFIPSDPKQFKILLLKLRKATMIEYYHNGQIKEKIWNASNFTENSSVIGNLRKRSLYRQGEWQRFGLEKLVVKIAGYDA